MKIILTAVLALSLSSSAFANLVLHHVAPNSPLQKTLALQVHVVDQSVAWQQENMPVAGSTDDFQVNISAPSTITLQALFGATLHLRDSQGLLLTAPLELRSVYDRNHAVNMQLTIKKTVAASAVIYLRCGTPASETVYEIALSEFL